MKNYYDKQIIPLKVRNSEAESVSLDTGYYIEGRLETFSKEQYFDDLLSIYSGIFYRFAKEGENMIDVGRWQHTEFIQEMNVASIRTNLSATILSWFSDTALKEIKYIKNKTVIFQMKN